jgi:hypothetical protein
MFKQIMLGSISKWVSGELSDLLDKYKAKYGEEKYKVLLTNLSNTLTDLNLIAKETKTKVDDTIVSILLNALPE